MILPYPTPGPRDRKNFIQVYKYLTKLLRSILSYVFRGHMIRCSDGSFHVWKTKKKRKKKRKRKKKGNFQGGGGYPPQGTLEPGKAYKSRGGGKFIPYFRASSSLVDSRVNDVSRRQSPETLRRRESKRCWSRERSVSRIHSHPHTHCSAPACRA